MPAAARVSAEAEALLKPGSGKVEGKRPPKVEGKKPPKVVATPEILKDKPLWKNPFVLGGGLVVAVIGATLLLRKG